MPEMTAKGMRLRKYNSDDYVTVALGDRVRLQDNDMEVTAHCWSERGFIGMLDPKDRYLSCNSIVAAFDAGDGDIVEHYPREG